MLSGSCPLPTAGGECAVARVEGHGVDRVDGVLPILQLPVALEGVLPCLYICNKEHITPGARYNTAADRAVKGSTGRYPAERLLIVNLSGMPRLGTAVRAMEPLVMLTWSASEKNSMAMRPSTEESA